MPSIPFKSSPEKSYILPDEHVELMPAKSREALSALYKRSVSAATDASQISVNLTVSEFLEKKAILLMSGIDFYREYQNGLLDAMDTGALTTEEYQTTMEKYDKEYGPIYKELRVLKRQRRTLEQDIEEEREQKLPNLAPEQSKGSLERAYSSAMDSRLMGTIGQSREEFNQGKRFQTKFWKDLIDYYHAAKPPIGKRIWCHILGWCLKEEIKAAHFVPTALGSDELALLFGDGELVLSDPRNSKAQP